MLKIQREKNEPLYSEIAGSLAVRAEPITLRHIDTKKPVWWVGPQVRSIGQGTGQDNS